MNSKTISESQRGELGKQIGKALREARARSGRTQADIAERVGLATEVYGRMERGSVLPRAGTLRKLSKELGVSASFILGLVNDLSIETLAQIQAVTERELPSDARRVMRIVREMEPKELSTFRRLLGVFAKHFGLFGKADSNG